MTNKLLLTFKEAATLLGVPLPTLHRWTSKGKIQKIAGTSYIALAEVERFAMVRSQPTLPELRRRGRYNVRRYLSLDVASTRSRN